MQLKLRGLGVAFAALVLSTATLGCPLLSKKDGGEQTAVDASSVAVSGSGAKNEAQIVRYPTETPLGNAAAAIAKDGTIVRTSPGTGAQIAVLGRGTSCSKVAQHFNTATLILFADQSGDGSTLLGWVPVASFDVGATNVKPITKPSGAVDGGASPANKDAGSNPSPPKVVDAGVVPVNPNCPVACAATPDGRCPTGKTNDNGTCRLPCKADTDCPRNTKCGSRKLCTSG